MLIFINSLPSAFVDAKLDNCGDEECTNGWYRDGENTAATVQTNIDQHSSANLLNYRNIDTPEKQK